MNLADRIREAMQAAQKSSADLARACGVKSPSVSQWLSGETRSMKAATAHRAAEYLGVNFLWLTEGRGPMRPFGLLTRPPALTPQEEAWLGYFRGMSAQEKEEALRESQAAQRRREEAAAGLSVEKLEELLRQKRSA